MLRVWQQRPKNLFPNRAATPPEMVVGLKLPGITLELNHLHLIYHILSLLLINLLAAVFCGEPWPKNLYPALQGGGYHKNENRNKIEEQRHPNVRNTKPERGLSG